MLKRDDANQEFEGDVTPWRSTVEPYSHTITVPVTQRVGDEEELLQNVPRNSFDAVVSCLSLHWVNDLPGMSDR